MSRQIEMTVNPFGKNTLNIWGAIVDDEPKIYCEVQDNFLVPVVSARVGDARAFADAIIAACDAAERTIAGLSRKPLGPML